MVSQSGHRNTAGVQLDAAKKFSGNQIRTTINIDLLHTHVAFSHVLTVLPDFFAGPPKAYTDKEKKADKLPIVSDPYVPADKKNDGQFDLTKATETVGGADQDYQHLQSKGGATEVDPSMKQKIGAVAPAQKAVDQMLHSGGSQPSNTSSAPQQSSTSQSSGVTVAKGPLQAQPFETVIKPTSDGPSTSAPQHQQMTSPHPHTSSSAASGSSASVNPTADAAVTVQGEDDTVDLDALIASLPASEAIEAKMKTDSTLSLLSFFSPLSLDLNVTDPIIQFTPELTNQTVGLHITVNLGAQAYIDTIGNRMQAEAAVTNLKMLAGQSKVTDARFITMPKSGWKLSSDDLTLTVDQPFLNVLQFVNGPAATMGQKLRFLRDHLQMIVKQNVFFINMKQ